MMMMMMRRWTVNNGLLRRSFTSSISSYKELPRPSEKYMADMGEQPIPLTENDMKAKDVEDIVIPEATLDEKAEIKKAMKKRSLRMTFWQLFLVTLLGSSTLNIMREKNLKEELDENFEKKFRVLNKLIKDAEEGRITTEEARDAMKSWNERFVDVFQLSPVIVEGVDGLDKKKLREAFSKIKKIEFNENDAIHGTDSESNKTKKEQLNKFL